MSLSSKLLASPTTKWAVGGWSFFIFENYILSENRNTIIRHLCNNDEDYYHYLYGSCSTIALGYILYGYRKVKDSAPFIASACNTASGAAIVVPNSCKIGSFLIMSLGFGFMSQTLPKLQIPIIYIGDASSSEKEEEIKTTLHLKGSTNNNSNNHEIVNTTIPATNGNRWKVRCPFDFTDSKSKTINSTSSSSSSEVVGVDSLHGLDRISRHPGLWSFGLISTGYGLLSPSIPTRLFMSMPLVVAYLGGSHSDSRHRRGMGGHLHHDLDAITSNVPFWAMITGKHGDVLNSFETLWREDVKGLNLLLGLGVAASVVAMKGNGVSRSLIQKL